MTRRNPGVRAVLPLPALVIVFALAACSSGGSGASPSSSTKAATVTSPAFVFDNHCSSIVSTADLTTDLGASIMLEDSGPWLDESEWAVSAVGGVRCDWESSSSAHAQSLDLIVVPASVGKASSYPAFDCVSDTASSIGECGFNAVYSGYWFSGTVQLDNGSTNAQAQAAAVRLETQLKRSAVAAGKAPAIATITGAWPKPISCSAVDSAGRISQSLGSPAVVLQGQSATIESGNPDAYTVAVTSSSYLPCSWESADSSAGFGVYLYPGGAWAKPDLLSSSSKSVSVRGATSAYLSPGIEGSSLLDVFVGPNAFVVEQDPGVTDSQLETVAAAVITGMKGMKGTK